ncbi:hypothetical protein HPK19_16560 [Arthrobacter citreus]|nr:hypothetical protein HPK19_16560 [Arthrobacter citreus]
MYKLRSDLLLANDLDWFIHHVDETVDQYVKRFYPENSNPEDLERLEGKTALEQTVPSLKIEGEHLNTRWEVLDNVNKALFEYKTVLRSMDDKKKAELISILKNSALSTIDLYWSEHLEHLQHLIEGINLRQYQQEDPIRLYELDGFTLFEHTFSIIQQELSASLASTFQELSCPQGVEIQNVIID